MATTTVTGTWLKPNGDPANGRVTFRLVAATYHDGLDAIFPQTPVTAALDDTGSISIELEPTSGVDADFDATDMTYEVVERITGAQRDPYYVDIPTAAGVDLGALATYEDPLHVTRVFVDVDAAALGIPGLIAAHSADTTDVHGIVDTAALVTDSELTTALADYPTEAEANATYAKPKKSTVVLLGDSLTALNDDPALTGYVDTLWISSRGYFNWANAFLGQRFKILNVAGYSGQTATYIKGQIASGVDAYDPDWVVVCAGVNSVGNGHTSATIITDLTDIVEDLQAQGRRVVMLTIPPSTSFDTSGEKQALNETNDWIRRAPATYPGLVVVDAWTVLADPSTGYPFTAMTIDGVHFSLAGAARVGRVVADALSPLLPAARPNIITATHPKNISGNPHMAAGTGWTTLTTTGVTYTFQQSTGDDLGSECLITASGVTATGEYGLTYEENTSGGRWAPGDTVQASVEVEWNASARVAADNYFRPYSVTSGRDTGGVFTSDASVSCMYLPSSEGTVSADRFPSTGTATLLTNKLLVPSGINRLYFQLRLRGMATGTMKFRKFSAWKV